MTRTLRRRHHPLVWLGVAWLGVLSLGLVVQLLHYAVFLVLPAAGWCRQFSTAHRRSGPN